MADATDTVAGTVAGNPAAAGMVRALIEAGDSSSLGHAYGQAIEPANRAAVTSGLLAALQLRVTGWLPQPLNPDTAIRAIHEHVAAHYARVESLVGVNLVLLEHLARSTVGLSEFISELTEEQVCLYAAVLLNAVSAGSEGGSAPARADLLEDGAELPVPEGISYDIAEAAFCAGTGDPKGWQEHARRALEVDADAADRAVRQQLADRLSRQDVRTGQVAEIANGAYRLAAAVQDGPFACPMYLLELVIRRALAEPGCTDHVDQAELVYAGSQACGLLDLSVALLPPGWGWAVHGPLSPAG
ncbi:MAG TPA: hypothetical protein VHO01_06915 [Jatrophihabitans sp.]|nr:hypothetical protein [Jatrophihabitans sp.]